MSGVQLDRVSCSGNMDATVNGHLQLSFEDDAELVALMMQRGRSAGGVGLVSVFRQLKTALGIVDQNATLDSGRSAHDLLVLRAADDRILVGGLDRVQQLRHANSEGVRQCMQG